ncbi:helix-turn-helix domain-containing protein [uncultured Subdoligranulum sp.]|uniref:helix-turn-helix domain-containing protein n=1 Tax=uncultured Subdoligranulum sp. TaxID=512298 RepID=UPI0032088D00
MDLSQKTLGAKIAALRKIRNMTQEQLAAQLGISAPAVSKWETGSSYPDITLLAPLARALGTNLDMIRYFTSSQVAIARETRSILCADLSQNHTARELAERFQVAETSLKNYFRGVFGENLSTFLREARMRRAAELLQSSELRVAEIAAQVGYENQSKFAAVFVRRFGCPPLEYRRRARLSIADDD